MVLALRLSHSEPLVRPDNGRVGKCTILSGVAGFLSPTVSKISTVEQIRRLMDRYKYNYIIDRCAEAYIGTVVDPWIRVDE